MIKRPQNIVNHIAIGIDASGSMAYWTDEVIKIVDGQVRHLAVRSKELGQETRVTIYVFSTGVECVVYDMDVLRTPSIAEFYRPGGLTSLVDATTLALDDLAMTPEKYGDHSFLLIMATDGYENNSTQWNKERLPTQVRTLPNHWTVAVLVPDANSIHEAKKLGFPADNIAVWNSTNAAGVMEAGETIRKATDRFMDGRAQGIRGGRSVFSTGTDAVNPETIQQAGLAPLPSGSYILIPVPRDEEIRPFVQNAGHTYVTGHAYYQLSKTEKIQPQKSLVVVEKNGGKVYSGDQVRQLIGLPNMHVSVRPDFNPLYDIYVQSTSVNRKLKAGTRLLLLL